MTTTRELRPAEDKLETMVRRLMDEKGMDLTEACDWMVTHHEKLVMEAILESVRGRLQ